MPRSDAPAPAPVAEPKFLVREFIVEGATAVSREKIEAVTRQDVGRELGFSDLRALAGRITALYASEGYGLSFVVVPEQIVENGVVRLRVVEAKLGEIHVRVEGRGLALDADRIKAQVARRLAELAGSELLRTDSLERAILLLDDLEGVSARVTVVASPSADRSSDIIVEIESVAASMAFDLENRLRPDFGRYSATARHAAHSIVSLGDAFSMSLQAGLDVGALYSTEIGYRVPLGTAGLAVHAAGSAARTRAKRGVLGALEFRGEEDVLALGASYPIIRSRRRNLVASVEANATNSRSFLLGEPVTEDRVRHLSADLSYDWFDRRGGKSLVAAGLAKGFNGLGATSRFNPLSSRTFGTPDFTTLTLRYFTDRPIGPLRARADFAGEWTLGGYKLASVECAYGGRRFGQGYFSGAIGGDHCAQGSIELSWPGQVTPFILADAAYVRQRGPLDIDEERSSQGASAGIGVRAFLQNRFTVTATAAKPLIDASGDGPRLFLSAGVAF